MSRQYCHNIAAACFGFVEALVSYFEQLGGGGAMLWKRGYPNRNGQQAQGLFLILEAQALHFRTQCIRAENRVL